MAYHKRYEDSYLDDEDFDLETSIDVEKMLVLIQKAGDIEDPVERNKRLRALWSRLSDVAEKNADRDLYYRSLDALSDLG